MIELAAIHVYPIKSCAGLSVTEATFDRHGLVGDRRWQWVDDAGVFVTQRHEPGLARIQVEIAEGGLRLRAPGRPELIVPSDGKGPAREVQVWISKVSGVDLGDAAADWIENALGRRLRLVGMAPDFERRVNPKRAPEPAYTSFTDGYPLLVLGEASLADLNARLDEALPMNRFRPNLVLRGSEPYAEDTWKRVRIGSLEIDLVKPCERCLITTIDQESAEKGREPLATLARYRRRGEHVVFGQNGVHRTHGRLAVGDTVEVLA
ncbi:MAG: MOSC domain-containing protein [Proteobacteria bacterium]|nr:MOSC domain-containing protein [Pseudomonadota bacterium]